MTKTFLTFASSILLAVSASAATVTYNSTTIADTNTNWTNSLNLQQFNPTLGTLNSIQFTINGDIAGSVGVESKDAGPSTINSTLGASLTLERPDTLATLVIALPGASNSFSATAYDGTLDFGGTSGHTYSGLTASNSVTSGILTDASLKALFTGVGFVSAPVIATATSTASGPGNLYDFFQTQAGASASVTYNYSPSATPEPSSMALMGLGLGAAGLFGRKRFAKRG
jgi:PEP-CTERM motif